MVKGVIIILIFLALVFALYLNDSSPPELILYRDLAIIKINNELDISNLKLGEIYGRYELLKTEKYVGKQAKFLFNNKELEGVVIEKKDGYLIIKDQDGYYYKVPISSAIFKEYNIESLIIKPISNTYVSIYDLNWRGKNILRVESYNRAYLDIGVEIANNYDKSFTFKAVELIDTNIGRNFYYGVALKAMEFEGVEAGRVMDSKILYRISNLIIPAQSKISKTLFAYEVDLSRVNKISFYIPTYRDYNTIKGNPSIYISFLAPNDIPSGNLDIYHGDRLVKSISSSYYLKNNEINLELWENKGIEYTIEVKNKLTTDNYRTYPVSTELIVRLKNINVNPEIVSIELYLDRIVESVEGDFSLEGNIIKAKVNLTSGTERELKAKIIYK